MGNSDFTKHQLNQPAISTKNISGGNNGYNNNNFETREPEPPKKPRGKRILKWIVGIVIVLALGLGAFVAIRAAGLLDKIFIGQNTSLYQRLTDIISPLERVEQFQLLGEYLPETILLLPEAFSYFLQIVVFRCLS